MPRIVYDIKLKRPACAILQAIKGGDPLMASHFDSRDWLIHPTDDMQCYEISEEQLKQLVERHNRKRSNETIAK